MHIQADYLGVFLGMDTILNIDRIGLLHYTAYSELGGVGCSAITQRVLRKRGFVL